MQYNFEILRFDDEGFLKHNLPILNDRSEFETLKESAGRSKYRCVIIIDDSRKFKNLVTQGDIIRFELQAENKSLQALLERKEPAKVAVNSSQAKQIALKKNLEIVPITRLNNTLHGILIRKPAKENEKLIPSIKNRLAIIIAGGKGTRLGALTERTPKPLLNIGGAPIIEHVMSSIEFLGFHDFYLLCGHLIEKFEVFSEKTRFNVKICSEDTPLGTGGPFIKWIHDHTELVNEFLQKESILQIIIANGDLLLDIESQVLTNFERSSAKFGIVGRRNKTQIKYGTMIVDEDTCLVDFVEKPVVDHIVNTGVYFISMDKSIFNSLKNHPLKFIGMPDLLQNLASELDEKINVIEISGNYLDLGTPDDLNTLKHLMER